MKRPMLNHAQSCSLSLSRQQGNDDDKSCARVSESSHPPTYSPYSPFVLQWLGSSPPPESLAQLITVKLVV